MRRESAFTKAFVMSMLVWLALLPTVQAQKQAHNWVLGNYELDFNSGAAVVKRNAAEHQNRGMGVISDENGALLFYTDGYSVWNKNHQLMPNGKNLLPVHTSTSTQESIIIPKPGDPKTFYVLSVDPWNGQSSSGLYYSEVDLTLDGGLGDIVAKGVKIVSNTSNKLSAVIHANQKDVWVIVHKHNTNTYYTIPITAKGISHDFLIQHIGLSHGFFGGQLKFSPDGKKMAVSYADPTDGMSLFDFNPASGLLSNHMDFSFHDLDNSPWVEGLEFSSDATKVYVYDLRTDGVYQFDLSQASHEKIRASRFRLNARIIHNGLRHFQLGPDGKIYITKGGGGGGTEHLGVIINPNAAGHEVLLEENGLYLEGGDSFVNYTPNFIQSYFFKTSFTFDATCQASPVQFKITNIHRLDSVQWLFGDGTSSRQLNPKVQFTNPGTYTVKLLAYYPGKFDIITQQITINPFPVFELGEERSVCYGSELSVPQKFKSYLWNTGDTTQIIKINQEGWYKLTTNNGFGCSASDSVYISLLEQPQINLPDTLYLTGGEAVELVPGEFHTYSWSTGETTASIWVQAQGWYSVAVENEFGCKFAKSVFVMGDESSPPSQQSDWIRLNPRPTIQSGRDSYFIDDQRGFIITGSELLITRDGGNSWQVQMNIPSGQRINFKNQIGYIVGDRGLIYKSTHLGEGWNKINVGFNDDLNAISLIHQDTIRVTSNTRLYISNDGGKSWETRQLTGVDIEDSYFTSALVGHVACKNGKLMKTIDGGLNWTTTASSNSIPSDFIRITFVNELLGFASRHHSYLYRTTDGGETWQEFTGHLDKAYAIHFINEKVGFIAGEHGSIHKTQDGGNTWKWIGFDGRKWANDLYSIFFINENLGFATGLRGRIIKTLDGGLSWQDYSPTYNKIGQINFTSKEVGYMLVGNEVFKSTNSGLAWTNMGAPAKGLKTAKFDFVNNEVGFALVGGDIGSSGTIGSVYKTVNGGISWTKAHHDYAIAMEDLTSIEFTRQPWHYLYHQPAQFYTTAPAGKLSCTQLFLKIKFGLFC